MVNKVHNGENHLGGWVDTKNPVRVSLRVSLPSRKRVLSEVAFLSEEPGVSPVNRE